MTENGSVDLKSEDMRRDRSRSRSPIGKDRDSRDRFRDGPRRNRERDRDRESRRGSDRDRSRAPSNCRVYVANIPFDMKWQDLKDLFREKVGEVSFVELFEEDGKPRGCGIVEFKEQELVQKAIDILHRHEIKGRQIVVKEDFDIDRDRSGRPLPKSERMGGGSGRGGSGGMGIMGGMGNMGNMGNLSGLNNIGAMNAMNNMGSMSKWGNTFGLSPQFLESLGISGPLTCKIFVANLDYNVTERKLREIFRMAGRVTNVDLKVDKDGKSKGHGTIEFEHPVEAVQAISMFNSQILFDRKMSVRMDKYSEKDEMGGGLPSKLPSGLKGIGMGLGSGGHPLTNVAGISALTNMTTMGGGTTGGMNLMGTSMGMGLTGNEMGAAMGSLGSGMGGGGGGGAGMNMNAGGMGTGLGGMGTTGMGMAGNTSGMMGANLNNMNPGMGSAMGGSAGMGTGMGTGMGSGLGSGMGTGMASAMGSLGGSGFGGGNTSMSDIGRPDYDYMDQRDYRQSNEGFSRGSRVSDTICVRNLPNNFTWQNLRDRFRDVGDVKYAEMRGKGVGMIRFSSEREAQRAINLMDGARVEGRLIEVYLQ